MSQTTLYERLGGEAGLTALIDKYLELLRTNPAYEALSSRYVNGMAHYRARMLEYLTGWFGGPVLYAQKHGLPCLRENHQRIQITAPANEFLGRRDNRIECVSKLTRLLGFLFGIVFLGKRLAKIGKPCNGTLDVIVAIVQTEKSRSSLGSKIGHGLTGAFRVLVIIRDTKHETLTSVITYLPHDP